MEDNQVRKTPSAEKLKALQLAMDKIEKDHGKGTIMRMGDHNEGTIGVCYVGGLDNNKKAKDTRTEAQKLALHRLVDALKTAFPTIKKVSGHYMYDNKACPCFDVRAEFGE